ncbi:MAG: SDR family NAD(P)-dependent oxidoreductase [Gemmatimonadota bacterium]|nr:SDR family NAD(P)-dependent oxidoreductase [Gemmatimonadota bacterium]
MSGVRVPPPASSQGVRPDPFVVSRPVPRGSTLPVALITGASSGLGRGLAVALAAEGYDLALVARRADLLEAVAADVLDRGQRAVVLPCDVSDADAALRAVRRCEEAIGPVDLLVANAGVQQERARRLVDAAAVRRVYEINVLGAVHFVDPVLPRMLEERRGHLVCVSSVAGYGGLPFRAAYASSKAAMTTWFESLRIELRGTGVDVTVINPGWVRTPMTEGNFASRPFGLELDDAVRRMTRAILERRRSFSFPLPVALAARFGRLLPRSVYDRVLEGRR